MFKRAIIKKIFEALDRYTRIPNSKEGIVLSYLANPNALDPQFKRSHLAESAYHGFLDVVELLIELGADPNKGSASAAYWLAKRINNNGEREHDVEILKKLIEAGADLDDAPFGESSARYLLSGRSKFKGVIK